MIQNLQALLFLLCSSCIVAQTSHFGGFYGYGAHFNTHKSNNRVMTPSDGWNGGVFYHLDNGNKRLGFRAGLAWRQNDVRFRIADNINVVDHYGGFELKLQCILPLNDRSSFGLGIAPRMVTQSYISMEYFNRSGISTIESQRRLMDSSSDLNELNTALSLSWYLKIAGRFSASVNLDQDMISFYRTSFQVCDPALPECLSVNARLTSLTASLIFSVR